jgi:hypothetical protein
MNLESPKVNVAKSAEYLFNALNDVKNFEKGWYVLKVSSQDGTVRKPFVVEK